VEDRFGNSVSYEFSGAQLTKIESSDGGVANREISLVYESGDVKTVTAVAAAPASDKTWTYAYSNGYLTSVTLPDHTSWTHDTSNLRVAYSAWPPASSPCHLPPVYANGEQTWTFTHPNGATGRFTFAPVRHSRTEIPMEQRCKYIPAEHELIPGATFEFDTYALVSKQLSGAGLPSTTWTATYTANVTTLSNPDNSRARYTFGTKFYVDEGRLQLTEVLSPSGAVLRSTAQDPTQFYRIGVTLQEIEDAFGDVVLTVTPTTTISQDGATFRRSTPLARFNEFGQPLEVERSSSLGFTKTDLITYENNKVRWVLGQVASVIDEASGMVPKRTLYDPATALPSQRYAFGKLVRTLTYSANGTLATSADGKGNTTTFSVWKRGLPQLIQFADLTTQSAKIDDLGWIRSFTNENGDKTSYDYDDAGRISTITYPPGWLDTTIKYELAPAGELGVAGGTWRREETTGTFRKRTYYDARLRPILEQQRDTASGEAIYTRREHDYENRETFASYPSGTYDAAAGVALEYDGLGRPTSRKIRGGITLETIEYIEGSRRRATDARGNATVISFQAFDEPSYENAVRIEAPETQTTVIDRDVFGAMLSATQAGLVDGSLAFLTRSYVYNANHLLCKRIEPETGQRVVDYDLANNVAWSADGQSGSLTSCTDLASVPAAALTTFSHDKRNRVRVVDAPGTDSDVTTDYWPTGDVRSVTNAGSAWAYTFNNRRMPLDETLTADGLTFRTAYRYTPMGLMDQITYPSDRTVNLSPDAFGRGRLVGPYATDVHYHPNSALKDFVYGNGLSYSLTLDSRQRPKHLTVTDGSTNRVDLQHDYDDSDNIWRITDASADTGGADNREMAYDGLNRLKTATGVWGQYGYSYDPFNNLLSRSGTNPIGYEYDETNRLTRVTGAISRSYTYNNEGQVEADGSKTFRWNGADRITEIPGVATYAFDGMGKRFKTVRAGGVVEYSVYSRAGVLMHSRTFVPSGGDSGGVQLSPPVGSPQLTPPPLPTPIAKAIETVEGVLDVLGPWEVNVCSGTTGTCLAVTPPSALSPGDILPPGPTLDGVTVTFNWSAISVATYYRLRVLDLNTGDLAVDAMPANGPYTATLNANTAYAWSVRGCNDDGCSVIAPPHYFQTGVAPPATPADPSPGTTGAPGPTTPDKAVLLSWSASSGATSYAVLLQDLNTGDLVVNSSTTGTSYAVDLAYLTPYAWSVSACNPAGCSDATGARYFQTPAPPSSAPPPEKAPDPVQTFDETRIDYLSLSGQAIAEVRVKEGTAAQVIYLNTDLLNSPIRWSDAGGGHLATEQYAPYGEKLNGVVDKLGYTAHAHDFESGLTYMQARFYDSQVGRFLSADPVEFDGSNPFTFNRYSYANNNPYRYTDPTGMCTGSRIENDDGTCASTGGFTTDTAGAVQGLRLQRARQEKMESVSTAIAAATTQLLGGSQDSANGRADRAASTTGTRTSDSAHGGTQVAEAPYEPTYDPENLWQVVPPEDKSGTVTTPGNPAPPGAQPSLPGKILKPIFRGVTKGLREVLPPRPPEPPPVACVGCVRG
jgi:RHS repeat-associated protein